MNTQQELVIALQNQEVQLVLDSPGVDGVFEAFIISQPITWFCRVSITMNTLVIYCGKPILPILGNEEWKLNGYQEDAFGVPILPETIITEHLPPVEDIPI